MYELRGKEVPALGDLQKSYRRALDHPIDSPPGLKIRIMPQAAPLLCGLIKILGP